MNNFNFRLFMVAALLCGIVFLANCGGTSTGTNNTAVVVNKSPDAPKTTDSPKPADSPKSTDTVSADSVGVPECDEYIKKYEACLTKIAEKAPQVQPQMKTAFEQQRNGFKQAASTAQGKTMLATQCKQFIESAKASTSAYACTW